MKLKRYATLLILAVLALAYCNTSVSVAAKTSSVTTKSAVTSPESTVMSKKSGVVSKKASNVSETSYTASELRLMASIINCEAGAESFQGKLAVGIVVMNRVSSSSFPNTIRGVIYQKGQFSPVRNGALKKRLAQYDAGRTSNQQWKDCILAAQKVLNGQSYITYRGNKKNMKSYHFFSVYLSGARFRLGGHRFK